MSLMPDEITRLATAYTNNRDDLAKEWNRKQLEGYLVYYRRISAYIEGVLNEENTTEKD